MFFKVRACVEMAGSGCVRLFVRASRAEVAVVVGGWSRWPGSAEVEQEKPELSVCAGHEVLSPETCEICTFMGEPVKLWSKVLFQHVCSVSWGR